MLFKGEFFMSKIILSILLAGLFYVVLLVCFKIMGKREVNQLSTVDIVINILIANVAAGGIVEEEYWLDALGGVLVLVMLQILMAKFQIKYPRGRDIIEGESSMVIKNGFVRVGGPIPKVGQPQAFYRTHGVCEHGQGIEL